MYGYTVTFTIKLTTTLFHMWNVKQKDDGIGQNTLHCCYRDYVITNQQA